MVDDDECQDTRVATSMDEGSSVDQHNRWC